MALSRYHQFECDTKVLTKYFQGLDNPCTTQSIERTIVQIMSDLPKHRFYVGITSNPCQRFKQSDNSAALPSSINFPYKISGRINEELITERAHYLDYDQMYLICFRRSKELIRISERIAIAAAWSKDVKRVDNDNPGGNGNLPDSDYYWLYVCVKQIL